MRRKKHKHSRRAMSFYKVNFKFREPYKVLLDGNFLHATLAANMTNLQGLLEDLLGGTCKLFTSRCVGKELSSLGPGFSATAAASRAHALHHCGHDPPLDSASGCISEQVGPHNASHWVVATQDRSLRAALAAVPGAPVVFATVNGIHLSEPSDTAKALVASGTKAAQALPLHELGSEALRDLHELREPDEGYKKFRRKRVKGPNPLAVQKKKKKRQKKEGGGGGAADGTGESKAVGGGSSSNAGGGGGGGSEGEGKKKKRKRRKSGASGSSPARAGSGDG